MSNRHGLIHIHTVSINELRKTHDLKDVGDFARQSFLDIIEWGHNKLTACRFQQRVGHAFVVPEEQSIYKTLGVDMSTEFDAEKTSEEAGEENLDDDGNQFDYVGYFCADYKCLLACGYKSLQQLMKECMLRCDCMTVGCFIT